MVWRVQNRGILLFIVDGFMTEQATDLPHIFKKSCMTYRSGTNERSKAQLCFSVCPYKLDKPFTVWSNSSGGASECNILNASPAGLTHSGFVKLRPEY